MIEEFYRGFGVLLFQGQLGTFPPLHPLHAIVSMSLFHFLTIKGHLENIKRQ